ncbi:MAG: PfkB family carbohydrate kinase [Propionibacteriaceae bacterium]|jgi:fructokinase|nr:PfkB family carbohydrate kinase [Propionibacteriaceae bacterium]
MNPEILVLGESLIDVVDRDGEPTRRLVGGSPLNVAVGLGRLGHQATLGTWFADDTDGQMIRQHCLASHVDLLPGSDQARTTSTAAATIDATGHASYTFALDCRIPPVRDNLRPAIIHTGSIGAILNPSGTAVRSYVKRMRGKAIITYDPNCRPSIMGSAASVRPQVEQYVALSTMVKVSDEDLGWLYPNATGREDLIGVATHWATTGPSLVVVTLGGDGAIAITGHGCVTTPADTSHGLVDTVGAGDSFMAGLIHALIQRGYADPARRTELGDNPEDVKAITTQAAAIAGITVSRAGANPPWLSELTGPSHH